ncbi:hypothetical protein [Nocardia sp. NPDC004604]|uniref:hypothetical protein n=1 Tax=Nocardia sp. NPDC004604 TaxID=3157013 RepID=UPI0033A0D67D
MTAGGEFHPALRTCTSRTVTRHRSGQEVSAAARRPRISAGRWTPNCAQAQGNGAPITSQRAETRLGYNLDQNHTAAVVWNPDPTADPGDLERAAQALARAAGASRPLTVIASAATLWVWIPGPHAPDSSQLQAAMDDIRRSASPSVLPHKESTAFDAATWTR